MTIVWGKSEIDGALLIYQLNKSHYISPVELLTPVKLPSVVPRSGKMKRCFSSKQGHSPGALKLGEMMTDFRYIGFIWESININI